VANNLVGWFEIPVSDMDRAIRFYESVLGIKTERHQFGPLDMAWFPWDPEGTGSGGSLVFNKENYKPSKEGILIYLTANSGDLANELGRVEKAGGKVLLPKRQISEEYGFMALLLDTEGNRIALHSRK
jgi:predicted enzyme related to lactoylglutathione lyase